jgi:hypothetical protein
VNVHRLRFSRCGDGNDGQYRLDMSNMHYRYNTSRGYTYSCCSTSTESTIPSPRRLISAKMPSLFASTMLETFVSSPGTGFVLYPKNGLNDLCCRIAGFQRPPMTVPPRRSWKNTIWWPYIRCTKGNQYLARRGMSLSNLLLDPAQTSLLD